MRGGNKFSDYWLNIVSKNKKVAPVSVHFFQHLTTSGTLLSAEKPLQMELSSMTEQKPSGAAFPHPPPPPTRTVPLAREIQQT